MAYTCTLEMENNKCKNLLENKQCSGNTMCCFCKEEIKEQTIIEKTPYVRKERWYEQYYKESQKKKRNNSFF